VVIESFSNGFCHSHRTIFDNFYDNSHNFNNDSYDKQNQPNNNIITDYINNDEENEPSILEELDIDLEGIKSKFISILKFGKFDDELTKNPDMIGPF